jgi:CBS domain-containing protein
MLIALLGVEAVMAGLVSVRDVMSKNPKVVRRDTSVQEIVATMAKFDISSVIVVQEERPVGIVTHKDIVSKVVMPRIPPDALKAIDVMSTPVVKISEDASIEEAANLMARKRIKKLIVVSGVGSDKLVGIITSTDIVKAQPTLITLVEKSMKTLRI